MKKEVIIIGVLIKRWKKNPLSTVKEIKGTELKAEQADVKVNLHQRSTSDQNVT